MIDIDVFLRKYYGYDSFSMMTVAEFEEWKEDNDYEEWDYPLEEYEHIAENEIKCVPVRFKGMPYDYRFCEIP